MPKKANDKEVKTMQAVSAAFYGAAQTAAETLRDFGVAQVISADKTEKWVLFRIKNDEHSCVRMGDIFIVDVPNISKKYNAREKKQKEQGENIGATR